jgi:hypothetical protein
MTARMSSVRSSSVAASVGRSESPVPRLSKRMSRVNAESASMKRAFAGYSQSRSRCEMVPAPRRGRSAPIRSPGRRRGRTRWQRSERAGAPLPLGRRRGRRSQLGDQHAERGRAPRATADGSHWSCPPGTSAAAAPARWRSRRSSHVAVRRPTLYAVSGDQFASARWTVPRQDDLPDVPMGWIRRADWRYVWRRPQGHGALAGRDRPLIGHRRQTPAREHPRHVRIEIDQARFRCRSGHHRGHRLAQRGGLSPTRSWQPPTP